MTDAGDVVSHDRLRAELPELAADVLDGRARAELLAHVDLCPKCALELEELTTAVDGLVHLAGEADPPVGFESRVFEEMQRRPPRARRRLAAWRRPLAAVGAAAAVIAVAFGLGWALHAGTGGTHRTALSTNPVERPVQAALVSGDRTLGVVSVYAGRPGWLSMRVDGSSWNGSVRCTVTSADGAVRTVGWFSVSSGVGRWTVLLPDGAHSVHAASLLEPDGTVLATAHFIPAVTET